MTGASAGSKAERLLAEWEPNTASYANWGHVRFGSKADIPRHPVERPLLGAKRTSNVRFLSPKHSCADDVRFRGLSGHSSAAAIISNTMENSFR